MTQETGLNMSAMINGEERLGAVESISNYLAGQSSSADELKKISDLLKDAIQLSIEVESVKVAGKEIGMLLNHYSTSAFTLSTEVQLELEEKYSVKTTLAAKKNRSALLDDLIVLTERSKLIITDLFECYSKVVDLPQGIFSYSETLGFYREFTEADKYPNSEESADTFDYTEPSIVVSLKNSTDLPIEKLVAILRITAGIGFALSQDSILIELANMNSSNDKGLIIETYKHQLTIDGNKETFYASALAYLFAKSFSGGNFNNNTVTCVYIPHWDPLARTYDQWKLDLQSSFTGLRSHTGLEGGTAKESIAKSYILILKLASAHPNEISYGTLFNLDDNEIADLAKSLI